MFGTAASEMCLKTARLKITPFLRHCETSQGRYIAVLMHTDVNTVAWSIPGGRASLGSIRNCGEKQLSTVVVSGGGTKGSFYVGDNILDPWIRRKQLCKPGCRRRATIFGAAVDFALFDLTQRNSRLRRSQNPVPWKCTPASG